MYYKVWFDIETFQFWSGARDRMENATEEQKRKISDRIEDWLYQGEIQTDVQINDFVWFECDDIFYPEEDDDEENETEEDNNDDE